MSSRISNANNVSPHHPMQPQQNHQEPKASLPINAAPENKPITNPAEQLSLKTGISSDALRSQITAKFNPQPIPAPAPTPLPLASPQQPSTLEKIWQNVEQTATIVKDATVAIGAEVAARGEDAGRQIGTGIIEAANGSAMDVAEGVENIGSGVVDTLTGVIELGISKPLDEHDKLMSEGWGHLKQGIGEIGSGALQATVGNAVDNLVLMVGGRTVSAIQTVAGLEQKGRALDATEKAELQKVYGNSIDYDSIRIKEGYAGVVTMASGERAMTHGNTVYMKVAKPDANDPIYQQDPTRTYNGDLSKWYSTLVHESCHVWQGQNGGTDYMTKAVYAQQKARSESPNGSDDSASYDYAKGIKENKKWNELNPEQQAKMVQDAYEEGFFDKPNQKFTARDIYKNPVSDETAYINIAVQELRNGQGAP